MPRPCDHPTGPPRPETGCKVCIRYVENPKLREVWDRPTSPKPVPLKLLKGKLRNPKACPHLGSKLAGQPCGGDLHRCNLDGVVCSTVKCDDVKADRACQECPHHPAAATPVSPPSPAPTDPWKQLVRIPRVPALGLSPKRPRAVVTIASGQWGKEMLAVSGPLLQRYADRLDADYVVLDWPGLAEWPMSSKFVLTRILDHYERVCYVDADVIVRPGAVDLFSQCGPNELGAFNDWPIVLSVYPQFAHEFVEYRKILGLPVGVKHPIPFYVNTGVMVFSQAHREVFTVPDRAVPPIHCGEQNWWVSRMLDLKVRMKFLPAECNYQWWAVDGFRSGEIPADAILHFSGMNANGASPEKHHQRLREMQKWAGSVPKTVRIHWPPVDKISNVPAPV